MFNTMYMYNHKNLPSSRNKQKVTEKYRPHLQYQLQQGWTWFSAIELYHMQTTITNTNYADETNLLHLKIVLLYILTTTAVTMVTKHNLHLPC